MTINTWNQWMHNWNWILTISKNRAWATESLLVKPKIDLLKIENLESELGINYPKEFKDILVNYSSGIKFGWQILNEDTTGEFKPLFCGCGGVSEYRSNSNLWDFDNLTDLYKTYQSWLADCYNDPTDWYGKHYYDKIPFIEVPNGDLIVFDKIGQVVYLSHDDGPLHGQRLAENFIEYISLWSNLGCIGTESEQFSVFYNNNKQKLMENDPKIDRWKRWMNQ